MGFAHNSNKNMNVKATSFTNFPPPNQSHIVRNGAWIRKLEKEVLPPQWSAVGGKSSSSWAGCGATGVAGGMAATAATRLREAVEACW